MTKNGPQLTTREAAGYEDAGGFRRIFKRVMGLSHAEYRKRFQRAAS